VRAYIRSFAILVWLIGRLSRDQIEQMVRSAEQFKEEDDHHRQRLDARMDLENYVYNVKSTAEDDCLQDRLGSDDRQTMLKKCDETIHWMECNEVNHEARHTR
jgi:heat shock protein 1/8